ncbi:MAG: D-amino-acid transaminase [Chloroflexi bacterium]|nr:D-amino-acid transaminase [Chloroflexota bacterium]
MPKEVYLNGRIVPYGEAVVPIEDRGYQFADGIYEVIRVYSGQIFEGERHFARLERSAAFLELPLSPGVASVRAAGEELLRRGALREAQIYIQVTRGVAARAHALPSDIAPTVVVLVRGAVVPPEEQVERGVAAITASDTRWAHVHVKVIGLLPNVLAKQRAIRAGAYEAIFIRDGYVTDCTATNVFAVIDGAVTTPPKSNYILHGITREVVLELCAAEGLPHAEAPVTEAQLHGAEEIFVTGTNTEVLPIVTLNGQAVGSGAPGPHTRQLIAAFRRLTRGVGARAAAAGH